MVIESYQESAQKRRFNLWTYIDARDASQAIRLALGDDEALLWRNASDTLWITPSRPGAQPSRRMPVPPPPVDDDD